MKLKQYLTDSACPITTKMYGGLQGGTAYGSSTEYAIGANKIQEALHCILGSLGRDVGAGVGMSESGHIKEEFGIIEKTVKEYSRDLYSDRLIDGSYRDKKWPDETVKVINKNSKKLIDIAKKLRGQIDKGLGKATIRLGEESYKFSEDLAHAMYNSVREYPTRVTNAYQDRSIKLALSRLRKAKDAWLKEIDKPKGFTDKEIEDLIRPMSRKTLKKLERM